MSLTSQTSLESSNGQPFPVSTTSIPTPPPPTLPPPPPPPSLGNNKGTIDNIICQLGSAFALKDLGPLNYFLGIKTVPHVSGIFLSQKKYIFELLQSDGLSNGNPVSSLMVTSSSLSLDDSTAFSNPVKYQQVVGSLQYVTISRPDIVFAVNKVCQYMHALTENHWSVVKRILCYLHGTVEHDAEWAGDSDDRRSTRGFAIYLGSNLISWTARKQHTVSRSFTEAEYKALANTVAELTWLQALFNELGIRSSSTPILWCDNLGCKLNKKELMDRSVRLELAKEKGAFTPGSRYAYIDFAERNGFNKALALDQSKVGGKLINVEEARPRDDSSRPRHSPRVSGKKVLVKELVLVVITEAMNLEDHLDLLNQEDQVNQT
nr:hypothetical protein [Tanacetum cinerariifolium]